MSALRYFYATHMGIQRFNGHFSHIDFAIFSLYEGFEYVFSFNHFVLIVNI